MSNITIFEKQLPLRAYPEKDLDLILNTQFKFWVANLLNLKADKEDSYDASKSALKEQCIGMGFHEIKIMFEDYADSKMSIKPMANYFDRVLLGKIVSEYKMRNKDKLKIEESKKVYSDAEKERLMLDAWDNAKKEIKEKGVFSYSRHHIYDWAVSSGRMNLPSVKERKASHSIILRQQKETLKEESSIDRDLKRSFKKDLEMLANGNQITINKAKSLLLEEYLKEK